MLVQHWYGFYGFSCGSHGRRTSAVPGLQESYTDNVAAAPRAIGIMADQAVAAGKGWVDACSVSVAPGSSSRPFRPPVFIFICAPAI